MLSSAAGCSEMGLHRKDKLLASVSVAAQNPRFCTTMQFMFTEDSCMKTHCKSTVSNYSNKASQEC